MATLRSSTFTTIGDVCVSTAYAELFATHGLASLDALMSYEACDRLDKPGLPRWRERLLMELSSSNHRKVTLYLKRYRSPPARAQRHRIIHGSARHGTGWMEWYWMSRLAEDGVATVKPVAFAESMRRGRELASVVVTEAAPGQSLESWAHRRITPCGRRLVESLAHFVKKFHQLGYVHRDLYLSHIFIHEAADPSQQFCLIDLQRVMRPTWRRRRWVIKDLASLNYSSPKRIATVADRIRFLHHYLGVTRLGPKGKRLARRVAAKTHRIARHDRRGHERFRQEKIRASVHQEFGHLRP